MTLRPLAPGLAWAPSSTKRNVKNYILQLHCTEMNIIQAHILFFLIIKKKIKTFSWALKASWALGTVPDLPNGNAGPRPILSRLLACTVQAP